MEKNSTVDELCGRRDIVLGQDATKSVRTNQSDGH